VATTTSNEVARTLLKSSKYRAKLNGLRHTLTLADIVVPERCPVLGLPLRKTKGRQGPNSPSLDRLNPRLGYVPSNVLVVSWRANEIKKNATPRELAAVGSFYTQLLAHHAKR
jgi:hypothetical protein